MPNTNDSTELGLQICFGVFGVLSTLGTLAGLHHHDSLGCVLIRRLRRSAVSRQHNLDEEAANVSLEDLDGHMGDTISFDRRPTLPPSYEQSSEGLHINAVRDSGIDDGPANKPNGS